MTLSSKFKPQFTGSLKAKIKKILKQNDSNARASLTLTASDTSGILQALSTVPETSTSSSDIASHTLSSPTVWTSECYSMVQAPTRPSIPPSFFDASLSNISLTASSITCHPLDNLSSNFVSRHPSADQTVKTSASTSTSPNSSPGSDHSPERLRRSSKPILQSSRTINGVRPDNGGPKVSELIANYEALAAQSSPGPSYSSTGSSLFLSPASSNTLTSPLNHTESPLSNSLMEKRCRQDELRIRSLEKRLAELEKECEQQRVLISELRDENELFYTQLCEVNRQNRKLRRRVKSMSPTPFSSDDESDYGVEGAEPPAFESRMSDSGSSSSSPSLHSAVDIETLRSDMLARPHGVYDWSSENGSSERFYPVPTS